MGKADGKAGGKADGKADGGAEGCGRAERVLSVLRTFRERYHGMYAPQENVMEGLRALREAADADCAFLLELDTDNGVFGVIEADAREGLSGCGGMLVERRIGKNLFHGLIVPNEPAAITRAGLPGDRSAEREWMAQGGIDEMALCPVKTRTEFVGYIGICNPRRLSGDTDLLPLAVVMMANEVRAMLVMGKLALERTRSKILEDDDVLCNLFGGFEVWTNLGKMRYGDFASSQCCLMLIYLLLCRRRIVPVREIAEILWPDQLFDNPYAMVKGVAFRLRRLLAPICEKPIVVAKHGTYAINEDLMIILDTENFDRTCAELGRKDISPEERLALYKRAVSTYKGDLLPNFENEPWLLGQVGYFQMKYWNVMKEYLRYLDGLGHHEEFFAVAAKAMNFVYADGDVFALIVSVLLKQNRLEMARSCYLKAERLLTPEQRKAFTDVWNEKRAAR